MDLVEGKEGPLEGMCSGRQAGHLVDKASWSDPKRFRRSVGRRATIWPFLIALFLIAWSVCTNAGLRGNGRGIASTTGSNEV